MIACGTEGNVPLRALLDVMAAAGIAVTEIEDGGFRIQSKDRLEVHYLVDPVGRNMVQALAKKFGVDVHLFYHPEMADQVESRPEGG